MEIIAVKASDGTVEKEKSGCNPVPILESDKKDDGTTITISADSIKTKTCSQTGKRNNKG